MSSDFINDDVKGQLMALEAREQLLGSRLRRIAPVAVGCVVAAGAAFTAAHFMGPDIHPSTVDIPQALLAKFSDWVPGSSSDSGSAYESGVSGLTESLAGLISKVMTFVVPAIAGVGVVAAIVSAIAGRLEDAARTLGHVAIAGGMFFVASTILGGGLFSGSDESSQRELFTKAVSHNDYPTTRSMLGRIRQEDTVFGRYVLAQVILVKPKQSVATDTVSLNADLATQIAVSKDFKPDPATLYAIEHAAFGHAETADAQAYEESHLARQGWVKGLGSLLVTLGVIGLGAGLGLAIARLVIAKRLDRINKLLGFKRT
jgi:hypothetical protein